MNNAQVMIRPVHFLLFGKRKEAVKYTLFFYNIRLYNIIFIIFAK